MSLSIEERLSQLEKENALLRQKLEASSIAEDPELLEALKALEEDGVSDEAEVDIKKELGALLDDLEATIESLNAGTGMGLVVPQKIQEIRNTHLNE